MGASHGGCGAGQDRTGEGLSEVTEDDPVGGVVSEVAYDEDHYDGEDNPEGPVVLDETGLVPALGKVDGSYHLGHVDDNVQEHEFVTDKNPVGKEGATMMGITARPPRMGPPI